ncbi:UNVERIFIED_CONTAM: hypothetical protein RMT77_009242 [Armadillidium vulgare]
MISMWKVLYSIAYLFVLLLTVVHCRSAFEPNTNNLDRDSSSLLSQTLSLSRSKRAIFDSSCKGIYDRDLFAKLDRVCDDCYNLYRQHKVVTECRKNCFNQDFFYTCVKALNYDPSQYMKMVEKISNGF